ncbi:dTDP-4-dehydrorhamnose 3%2C5-epimerase [Bordetella ansorpii]|uniref:dTDP-4-dehydrorhamnose 3,5-epimerase n=1 Tax=Bordetella ansorpii TaxID=288768 RepID=A0A157S9T8_9BORD|nr:dTDP-4-dehydrorhamnose 3,5-epimerase [Bordetella ansorpii]SAI67178.1 dTDP-4-dehydrorhamnose 3%2C5-epimerase [Bordetella ansorpii]
MKFTPATIPGILITEPVVHEDARGYFYESFRLAALEEVVGRPLRFVQENQSRSSRNVLRGLHYQIQRPQAKLVRVVAGEIFDVAVDLRRGSPTFGQWAGGVLSAENRRQMWIPEGFAHGLLVLSDCAEVLYKVTEYYAPEYDRGLLWNDPAIGVRWPLEGPPQLSARDKAAPTLAEAETY